MYYDHFLFRSAKWVGEGKVSFSFSPDEIPFTMQWTTYDKSQGAFYAVQTVTIEGQEPMINAFKIVPEDDRHFKIVLENASLGSFEGIGIGTEESVAWEIRHPGELDGYEIYERLSEKSYRLRAEYCGEDTRTIITGMLQQVD